MPCVALGFRGGLAVSGCGGGGLSAELVEVGPVGHPDGAADVPDPGRFTVLLAEVVVPRPATLVDQPDPARRVAG
jgi:hypothetical protein